MQTINRCPGLAFNIDRDRGSNDGPAQVNYFSTTVNDNILHNCGKPSAYQNRQAIHILFTVIDTWLSVICFGALVGRMVEGIFSVLKF